MTAGNDRLDRLERLANLRASGALTEEEFVVEKQAILGGDLLPSESPVDGGGELRSWPGRRASLVFGVPVTAAIVGAALWAAWPAHDPKGGTAPAKLSPPRAIVEAPSPPPVAVTMSPKQQLEAAFRAQYGQSGTATLTFGEDRYTFRPAALIPVESYFALISVGSGPDYHAAAGKLSVAYLDRAGTEFRKAGVAPVIATTGTFGAINGWRLRRDLGSSPVSAIEGGGTWQGCTLGGVTLIELGSQQPQITAEFIPIAFENDSGFGEASSYDGRLERSGDGIRAIYTGDITKTVEYQRQDGRLVATSEEPGVC
jgi:hypothetical protein